MLAAESFVQQQKLHSTSKPGWFVSSVPTCMVWCCGIASSGGSSSLLPHGVVIGVVFVQ